MLAEWVTGFGPETINYSSDSVEARMMMNAPGVQDTVAYYAAKNAGITDWTQQAAVAGYPGKFGVSEFVSSAVSLNPTQQFTGSFTIYVYPSGPWTIGITTWNASSFQSLTYGLGPEWNRGSWPTPMGNTYQTISWTQPYGH